MNRIATTLFALVFSAGVTAAWAAMLLLIASGTWYLRRRS